MNGIEIDRMLALIESGASMTRQQVLEYVRDNKEAILRQLQTNGEAVIPNSSGKPLVLRIAAPAA